MVVRELINNCFSYFFQSLPQKKPFTFWWKRCLPISGVLVSNTSGTQFPRLQRHFSPPLNTGICMGWHVQNCSDFGVAKSIVQAWIRILGLFMVPTLCSVECLWVCSRHIEKKGLTLFWAGCPLCWLMMSRTKNECLLEEGCEPQFLRQCAMEAVCSSSGPVNMSFIWRWAEETDETRAEVYLREVISHPCLKLISIENLKIQTLHPNWAPLSGLLGILALCHLSTV